MTRAVVTRVEVTGAVVVEGRSDWFPYISRGFQIFHVPTFCIWGPVRDSCHICHWGGLSHDCIIIIVILNHKTGAHKAYKRLGY